MLSAQARYGFNQTVATVGNLALGIRLHPSLPEDTYDRQPLIGGDGRFGLVADVRLDNRDELSRALGLDRALLAEMADSNLLLLALERWGEQAVSLLLGDF